MVNWKKRGSKGLATTLIGIVGVIQLAGGLVFGQNFSGAISGFVRDSTGAVIPGTTVTAKHTETGLTRSVQTGEEGSYTMPALPVGDYEVTAEKPGFKAQVRQGITLVVAQEAVVNLTLDVGNLAEKITVTEETPIVNTTLSSVSGLVSQEQIKDLPLNGRSYNDLLLLNTNVNDNRSNTGAHAVSYSIGGKRLEANRWTINGMDYIGTNSQGTANAPVGISDQLLGVEAVREYNVLSHTYGAEYGKRSGGQITVVTTSGTNQWHGSAFEYLRNNKFDSRPFFSSTEGAPPFKRNQYGGSLGGPIRRDKMFIFGTYEGFRERRNDETTAIVPSAQARQGLIPCNVANPTNTAAACPNPGAYITAPNLVPGILPFFRYWPAQNGPELLQNGLPTGSALSYSNPWRPVNEDFGLSRFD
ncbi:MAG: TonB-dependent receptor, partial [Acidobacteria bacterium]